MDLVRRIGFGLIPLYCNFSDKPAAKNGGRPADAG